jgi:hypothetical protein
MDGYVDSVFWPRKPKSQTVISVEDNFELPHMDERDMACLILPDRAGFLIPMCDRLDTYKGQSTPVAFNKSRLEDGWKSSRFRHLIDL